MTKNNKLSLVIILALIVSLTLIACSSKPNTEGQDKVTIGYLPRTGNVLYFIANDLGYFAEEGIDGRLKFFKNDKKGLEALMADKIDTGSFATSDELSLIDGGAELIIHGGAIAQGSGIITLADRVDEFKNFKDYKGKTVGLVKESAEDVLFRLGMTEAGLDINKDVTIVELDSTDSLIKAVKKGEIDAASVCMANIKGSKLKGLKPAMYFTEVRPTLASISQISKTAALEENQELYKRFNRALIKAYRVYLKDHEKTVDIMQKYIKSDRDILMSEAYDENILINPNPNKNFIYNFLKDMDQMGYIESDRDFDTVIDEDIYISALESLIEEDPNEGIYLQLKSELTT